METIYNVNKYEQDIINKIKDVFNELPNKEAGWECDCKDVIYCLLNNDNPRDYFPFIGHGSFKEAYQLPHCSNYIIKFCSYENRTDSEEKLYDIASRYDIKEAFIPTWFVDFNNQFRCPLEEVTADSSRNEYYDSEIHDYVPDEWFEGYWANALEIQPKACIMSTVSKDYYDCYRSYGVKSFYRYGKTIDMYVAPAKDPIYNSEFGGVVPFKIVKKIGVHCKEWLELFLQAYGANKFEKLADFCEKFEIHDLSVYNIGYYSKYVDGNEIKYPIILDWLSKNF
ncbi:MAG: hypothetical protein KBT46_00380 [Ruminococcus sp.]|nr:hypothetical protein [Candidatus Copronaster equi]